MIENNSKGVGEIGHNSRKDALNKTVKDHWLHFIGRGLYKQSVFEREASKLGVQRAIPYRLLKSMDYGIPMLLGYHIRDQDRRYKDRRKISRGTGEIFGYFQIEGLVHNLPDAIVKDLWVILDCDCESIPTSKGDISRVCGSYSIVAICQCRNSWGEIIETIEKTCKKHKVDPAQFKYFISGKYVPFKRSMIIKQIKFTRGFHKVGIEGLDIKKQATETKNLVWILDYERRTYLKKADRRALESHSLEEMGVFNNSKGGD